MQNPIKLKQYRTTLYNKLKDIPDANNTEGEWERIKEAITDAANEVHIYTHKTMLCLC